MEYSLPNVINPETNQCEAPQPSPADQGAAARPGEVFFPLEPHEQIGSAVVTNPKDIVIRQGDERMIPPKIDTPLSDIVTSIKFKNGTHYNSSGLSVYAERIQPPLFKVKVSPQTPVGVYTVPFVASLLIQTADSKSPKSNDTVTGFVDPEFQVSKKYPTIGDITGDADLTIRVLPPLTVNEQFTGLSGFIRTGDNVSRCGDSRIGFDNSYHFKNRKVHNK